MTGFNRAGIAAILLLLITSTSLHADWRDTLNQAIKQKTTSTSSGTNSSLSTSTIASGLKEALKVASQRAVETVSAQGGFLNDATIRIAAPSPLDKLIPTLRKTGFDSQVDAFEESINHAAEQAAPEAGAILADTVSNMTFDDARTIYNGGDHAATDYLREKAGDRLAELFKPSITKSLSKTGATQKYQQVANQAAKLPIVGQRVNADLPDYVTQKAMDGLFTKLATEESAIRENPTARTTELLKTLWGN